MARSAEARSVTVGCDTARLVEARQVRHVGVRRRSDRCGLSVHGPVRDGAGGEAGGSR